MEDHSALKSYSDFFKRWIKPIIFIVRALSMKKSRIPFLINGLLRGGKLSNVGNIER